MTDDQVVIANDEYDMDFILGRLEVEFDELIWKRLVYLQIDGNNEDSNLNIKILKKCTDYKFLGSIILEEKISKQDIPHRLQLGKKSTRMLNGVVT